MERKKGILPFTRVELIQVVLKNTEKQNRQKWEKLQLSQKHSSYYFTVA